MIPVRFFSPMLPEGVFTARAAGGWFWGDITQPVRRIMQKRPAMKSIVAGFWEMLSASCFWIICSFAGISVLRYEKQSTIWGRDVLPLNGWGDTRRSWDENEMTADLSCELPKSSGRSTGSKKSGQGNRTIAQFSCSLFCWGTGSGKKVIKSPYFNHTFSSE